MSKKHDFFLACRSLADEPLSVFAFGQEEIVDRQRPPDDFGESVGLGLGFVLVI